jgi:hypothetical protein
MKKSQSVQVGDVDSPAVFSRSICLSVVDRSTGRELFTTNAFLSSAEAELIGRDGVDEFFEVVLKPTKSVPGAVWSGKSFCWAPAPAKSVKRAKKRSNRRRVA